MQEDIGDDNEYDSDMCTNCYEYLAAKDCEYGHCGNCCNGWGCPRHNNLGPSCPECGNDDDVEKVGNSNYCKHCHLYWDEYFIHRGP